MMFKTYLAVMTGGAVGTGLRLWLSGLLASKYGETFPVGTLAVNVIGERLRVALDPRMRPPL